MKSATYYYPLEHEYNWRRKDIELLQDEKIIMQDDAKSDFFGKGILYMTNKRIILEVKTGGFLSKTTEVKLDKALGTIKAVSAPGVKTAPDAVRRERRTNKYPYCKRREMGSSDQK